MADKYARKKLGREGEELACRYLESIGFQLEAANFRTRTGEIDLIMRDTNTLVFIEVKTRRSHSFGHGGESITRAKQNKIRETALAYMRWREEYAASIRFDAVIITYRQASPEILHIPSAF
ncbi:YraN family protein [Aneurinibacillus tyrosinisolvens]|uniref:YraN family protein n=1 Tax=Aneurinibacillus tyrosinisolvens TaxID=1443435 RepID=UPI00063F4849|nr:YraN family protein [Aneurinibacillus tyrosinisolvens]